MALDTLILEIKQLPLTTRLALVEIIAESVRQELAATTEAPELVMGMLGPEGSVPTDQELKEDYINYLDDKYK